MKINRIVNEGFMKTMLAAYLPGNSTVDLREVAVPTPGINQVLIKMKSSGICGSVRSTTAAASATCRSS